MRYNSLKGKIERTLLILGPPHSGKSVFSYLLFKMLRNLGNDCALVDCDIFSPTLRAYQFVSDDEDEHTYCTPHAGKRIGIPIDVFRSYVTGVLGLVIELGAIVLDGIGKHTDATDFLLELTTNLLIVCRDAITNKELEEHGFTIKGSVYHPFDFYKRRKNKIIRIVSYLGSDNANFDQKSLNGRLYGLRRKVIRKGNIDNIPTGTHDAVLSIAKFVLEEWL